MCYKQNLNINSWWNCRISCNEINSNAFCPHSALEQTPPLDLGSTSLPDGRKIRRVKRASNFMHNSKINKSQAVKPFIGTTIKKFTPVTGTDMINKNGEISNIITKHQCITAMSEYQGKSLEELRSEDYRINGNKPIDSQVLLKSVLCKLNEKKKSLLTQNCYLFQTGFVFGSPSYRNWFKTFYERSHGSSSSDTINQIFGGPSNNQIFGAPVHNAALESPTTNPVFGSICCFDLDCQIHSYEDSTKLKIFTISTKNSDWKLLFQFLFFNSKWF